LVSMNYWNWVPVFFWESRPAGAGCGLSFLIGRVRPAGQVLLRIKVQGKILGDLALYCWH
jgi:hypothetical protein